MAGLPLDLAYVARLARLTLSPAEQEQLGPQLAGILEYFQKLQELDIGGIEPTAHALPVLNVFRPDEVQPSLPAGEALRNAPAQADGLFIVPRIVE